MKVLHLGYSDVVGGGAFRASYRTHRALVDAGTNSNMFVLKKGSKDKTVLTIENKAIKYIIQRRYYLTKILISYFSDDSMHGLQSYNCLPSFHHKWINRSDYDIVHIHWIHAEMMSIEDIAQINKPIVWTLHDSWLFCGSEHLSVDNNSILKPVNCMGLKYYIFKKLSEWVWRRKLKYLMTKKITFVAPSRWMFQQMKNSTLLAGQRIVRIQNTIDTSTWIPYSKLEARKIFNISQSSKTILYGAGGNPPPYHKGFDLFVDAIQYLESLEDSNEITIIILGTKKRYATMESKFKIQFIDYLSVEKELCMLFSAVDCIAIPSRTENLPNIAIEGLCCGTVPVAFNIGGMSDIIDHKNSGYLAEPFSPIDFAQGLNWALSNQNSSVIHSRCRNKVESVFDYRVVVPKLISTYCDLA